MVFGSPIIIRYYFRTSCIFFGKICMLINHGILDTNFSYLDIKKYCHDTCYLFAKYRAINKYATNKKKLSTSYRHQTTPYFLLNFELAKIHLGSWFILDKYVIHFTIQTRYDERFPFVTEIRAGISKRNYLNFRIPFLSSFRQVQCLALFHRLPSFRCVLFCHQLEIRGFSGNKLR